MAFKTGSPVQSPPIRSLAWSFGPPRSCNREVRVWWCNNQFTFIKSAVFLVAKRSAVLLHDMSYTEKKPFKLSV